MRQVDTYFTVPHGRLKLRILNSTNSELIFYNRKENSNQRWSNYYTFHISQPKKFIDFLKAAFNIKIVVDKTRTLYRYKNAIIHLDKVANLGQFIEIEIEVKKGELQAKKLMAELLERLKTPKENFIKQSYSDLLLAKMSAWNRPVRLL